jgi:Protein of unknown function (DUF3102)
VSTETTVANAITGLDAHSAAVVARINEHHRQAVVHAREALHHAKSCGDLLLIEKANLGHGHWLPWLAKHIEISARTVNLYMQIAAGWSAIEEAAKDKNRSVADLSMRGALEYLTAPREAEATAVVDTAPPPAAPIEPAPPRSREPKPKPSVEAQPDPRADEPAIVESDGTEDSLRPLLLNVFEEGVVDALNAEVKALADAMPADLRERFAAVINRFARVTNETVEKLAKHARATNRWEVRMERTFNQRVIEEVLKRESSLVMQAGWRATAAESERDRLVESLKIPNLRLVQSCLHVDKREAFYKWLADRDPEEAERQRKRDSDALAIVNDWAAERLADRHRADEKRERAEEKKRERAKAKAEAAP